MTVEGVPAPRNPNYTEPKSVNELLPIAKSILQRPTLSTIRPGFNIKGGEKFLFVTDNSVDPLIIETMERACEDVGAQWDIVKLRLPKWTAPEDICGELFEKNYIPRWVWEGVAKHDRTAFATYYMTVHLHVPEFVRDAGIGPGAVQWFPWVTRFLMTREYLFPDELFMLLSEKAWRKIRNAKKLRITDPKGTDLSLTLGDRYWRSFADRVQRMALMTSQVYASLDIDQVCFPGHLMVYPWLAHANGTVVAVSTHMGPIPELRLTVEDGRVTNVQGGGRWGEELKRGFEYLEGVGYPGYPGPGVNWVEEISLAVDPKAARDPNWDKFFSSARTLAWMESRKRSGVIHIAVGTSLGGPAKTFVERTGLPLRHRDHEFYFVDYYADDEKIVDKGHLVALDDPEVKKVASKYGDPHEILREEWIPELEG